MDRRPAVAVRVTLAFACAERRLVEARPDGTAGSMAVEAE
jgi:hypothetical protein